MRSISSLLRMKIPFLGGRRREKKAPWVLRRCPEGMRPIVVPMLNLLGLLAHVLFFAGGMLTIYLAPLFLAVTQPDAAIARPVQWLQAHLSEHAFLNVYLLIQSGVVAVLAYGTIVYDYLHPRSRDMVSEADRPRMNESHAG
jgi:hypothetical protein